MTKIVKESGQARVPHLRLVLGYLKPPLILVLISAWVPLHPHQRPQYPQLGRQARVYTLAFYILDFISISLRV